MRYTKISEITTILCLNLKCPSVYFQISLAVITFAAADSPMTISVAIYGHSHSNKRLLGVAWTRLMVLLKWTVCIIIAKICWFFLHFIHYRDSWSLQFYTQQWQASLSIFSTLEMTPLATFGHLQVECVCEYKTSIVICSNDNLLQYDLYVTL